MKIKKKYIIPIILLSIGVILSTVGIINQKLVDENIQENKYETLARVDKFEINRGGSRVYYTYFFENKKYISSEVTKVNKSDEYLNKYFRVYISAEKPIYSKIKLEKEIKDIDSIKKAGF